MSPQSVSGQGFSVATYPEWASGGTLQFVGVPYQVLGVGAICDPLQNGGEPVGTFPLLEGKSRYDVTPSVQQGEFLLNIGAVVAGSEYVLALIPDYDPLFPTEDRDRVTVPIPGQTPLDFRGLRKSGDSSEGYGFVVVNTLSGQRMLDVGASADESGGGTQTSGIPPGLGFALWGVPHGDTFVYTLQAENSGRSFDGVPNKSATPPPMAEIVPSAGRGLLDGRIVITRNGSLVSDRIRPSQTQYDTDLQPDGQYVVTAFYGSDYDAAWAGSGVDERRLGPSPHMQMLTIGVDTTRPIIGALALDDIYADESPAGPFVLFSTKPLSNSAIFPVLADESSPGFATRPAYETRSLFSLLDGTNQGLFLGVGSYTIRPAGSVDPDSNNYADVNNRRPLTLPQFAYQVHSVPLQKGPRPSFVHPGLNTREQFRPRTPQEAVSHVNLMFSEPVKSETISAGLFHLTVNGTTVPGLSVVELGDSGTIFRVQIPTVPQTEGAFAVLSFVPDETVESRSAPFRPVVLACRTSWLMQKPHFRSGNAFANRTAQVGQYATLTTTSSSPPSRDVGLSFSNGVSWSRNRASLSLREQGDGFVPTLPAGDNPPDNCSYFGLTTTIHPCPPRVLACPAPVASQPHASSMLYGGGTGSVSLKVVFCDRATGAEVPLTDDDEVLQAGIFTDLSRLKLLSLHGPLTLGTQLLGESLPQNFWTSETEADVGFTTVEDRVLFEQTTERSLVKLHAWLWATRNVTQWDHLQTAYPAELNLRLAVRLVVREHVTYAESQAGPGAVPDDETPSVRSLVVLDSVGVTKAQEQAGTFYISCGITTGLPGNKMPFWKITL